MTRVGYLTFMLLVLGCNASPQVDVAADLARATGVKGAVVFRGGTEDDATFDSALPILGREQALRAALSNDQRIQASLARVRIAQADARQARLLPNPILNIDVRFPESGGAQIFETTLTGDLIAVLSMRGHIQSADHRLRGAAADALSTALDVMAEVLKCYASVQSIDAQLVVLIRREELARRLMDVANSRFNAGEGTRLDVLTLDAQRTQLAIDSADKRLERIQQRLMLARLVGRPRDAAEWELEPWQEAAPIRAPEAEWIDLALSSRPEIQSLAWELRALGEEVKLASLEPFQGGDIGAHGEHDGSWAVGPTVTTPLPIFDFGQAARAKAKAQREAAHHDLVAQTRGVIEEVRSTYQAYSILRKSLETMETRLLPLQEQQRAQAELAYRNGEADLTTLLIAENNLQESRSRLIEMRHKLIDAVIQLQRAAGGAGIAETLEKEHASTLPATSGHVSNEGATP